MNFASASIPVLRDGEAVIGETSIIIEPVGGTRLAPSLTARLWDRICDHSKRQPGVASVPPSS